MMLSAPQESFAQAVVAGKSQSDAYRLAYPHCVKWQDKSVWEAASKLAAKVAPRLAELQAELAEQALWSREKSVQVLAEIAKGAEKDADRVRAVAELNKMHGFEAATKVEHTGMVLGGPIPADALAALHERFKRLG